LTTFDRYIIRRILIGFIPLTLMLVIFYVALHYVEYMDDFFDRDVSTRQVFLEYYPNFIPEIVRLTSPLALFLAAILVTAKLSQELQIAVLMTSGVSIYRLMVPYLLLGLVVTGAAFWFNGWIVPKTNQTVIEWDYRYLSDQRGNRNTRNIHLQDSPLGIVAAGFYDRRSSTAYDVSLQRFDEANRIVERLDADQMLWVDSLRVWRMFRVARRDFGPDRREILTDVALVDTALNVMPRDLSRRVRDMELLTIPEARVFLASLARSGVSDVGQPMVEYWSKFTYPLATLILILLSLPLAAVRRPGGQAVQLGIGLVVAFVYLALLKLIEPLGYSGAISPLLAAALPHVVFGVVTVVALLRAKT
jgi:lipopolysaccharide export system permease protein